MTLLRDKSKRTKLRAALFEQLQSVGAPLAETIKSLRAVLAKDQETFSREVGVSLSTLRKIEQTGSGVSLTTVHKILDKYGLELVVRAKKNL